MVLDFNALTQPTMDIVMRDDEKTMLHITMPSQRVIEKLKTNVGSLKTIFAKQDEAAVRKVWELTAELMSFNLEQVEVTADELQRKYRMESIHLLTFLQHYVSFVKEINSAKN